MIHIEKNILDIQREIIDIRRELHQIPEIGFEEYMTSAFIQKKLIEYDIETHSGIGKTGVVGYLRGTVGDQTIGFRADMDALTIEEKTEYSFQSKNPGMMHACGHDAHMAMVLGLARYLSMHREYVTDNIVFLFQPAEEGPGGAQPMIDEGVIERFNIDKIMGAHVFHEVEEGKIGCRPGAMMAQTGEFDINICGLSGHGAMPQNGRDAIVIASNLVTAYQSIISRSINPIEGAVVTIGKMWAGDRRNVIAGEAVLEGTLRAFNEKTFRIIKDRMKEIAKGLEVMYHCSINLTFRDMYPAVVNDPQMVKQLEEAIGSENMEVVEPKMLAEDFSYFQRKIPGIFFFLGVKNEEKGHMYSLHNGNFTFNEDILLVGVQVYVNFLKHIKGLNRKI